jgi:hypothetical protein
MYVVVYFKNCDCLKYIKNTPTCFGSCRIHHQGVTKQYLTKITFNCSTVQVILCQCLAAYITCTVCVYTAPVGGVLSISNRFSILCYRGPHFLTLAPKYLTFFTIFFILSFPNSNLQLTYCL